MGRPRSKPGKVRMAGPLAAYAAVYESRLRDSGYTSLTTVNELRQMAHLSRWLEAGQRGVADLTRARVEQFLAERRAGGHGASCSAQGLAPLWEVLGELGLMPAERSPAPSSVIEALLGSFRRYLMDERGLVASTADAYAARARRFLAWCAPDGELGGLTASDVTGAVLRESAAVSVGSVQFFVAGLRSFLRFCFIEGLVGADLSAAALAVTGRRTSPLPQAISRSDAEALLRSCDRRRAIGRRDYAVIVTLLRLGLRAGEVLG